MFLSNSVLLNGISSSILEVSALLDVSSRPAPLYGNVTRISADGQTCEITTGQKRRQKIRMFHFTVAQLPQTHQSTALCRAIECWKKAQSEEDTKSALKTTGPRVTFFAEDDVVLQMRRLNLSPLPAPRDKRGQSVEAIELRSSNRRHHSIPKDSLTDNSKLAIDIGLVWWTSDLHGS